MEIPEKCKLCVFFKDINNNDKKFTCMLGHSLTIAPGCPNQTKENKYI